MKKCFSLLIVALLSLSLYAQNTIVLNTEKGGKTAIVKDEFNGFETIFSFNEINSVVITGTEKGAFSALSISDAYPDGEYGTPELPVVRKIIAVPIGATPRVVVRNYTTTEYDLSDYNIEKILPAQPPVSKSQNMDELEFIYNEEAYAANEYTRTPVAQFEELGTMRGMRLGMLFVFPVRYNPVAHTIIVYNDIDVEVIFENADYAKTQSTYQNTYSPYFKQHETVVFNKSVYDDHPDLYNTPIRMLVIANRMFEETLQPWIEWKTQKGFYMDVNYTDDIGTTNTIIKTFCHDKYNDGLADGTAPTFIVIVGDVQQVPSSGVGGDSKKQTDLYYASVDGDYFPEMYYSRMSAQTTQQLENIIEKILYYEKYQFEDPTYLDNVLLIAGHDSYWSPIVGRPQINYAADNYYNEEHGFVNIHKYLTTNYSGCYAHLNNVGFANYTAHCDVTMWGDPVFTISGVNALTNENKYFVAMGNCCLAADFGSNECIGEAFIRAEKKGAVGYIGSSPNSTWHNDFFFTVGAYSGSMSSPSPTPDNTSDGIYDLSFRDADFNCLSSHIFGGNLAVTYASTSGCQMHSTPKYYWEAYNVLGDGSLMPFWSQADENEITHEEAIQSTEATFTVNAVAGSYVALSYDGVLYGVGLTDEDGVAVVEFDMELPEDLEEMNIVVTRNQYQPYFATLPIESGFLCKAPASLDVVLDEETYVVTLTWEAPEKINDELLGYNLYRNDEKINETFIEDTTYADENLFVGAYSYKVSASYLNCEESEMTEAEVEIIEIPSFCLPPTNFEYITGGNYVTLAWDAPEKVNDNLLGYNIYRDGLKINDELIAEESFIDLDVVNESNYVYILEIVYENCEESPQTEGLPVYYLGIGNLDEANYQIYPNPADNFITIRGEKMSNIVIYNIKGQAVGEYTPIGDAFTIRDLAAYSSGIYLIKIISRDGNSVVKRVSITK